ncbi:MAG: A/G-specific adenine glycosylase [Deltaproteobacteria bacterium]|jgi:A/G-specific adenine glycosylase|nr:A/G-specific adenine glycosylase [Deltaproteobacteria bacterium]
MEKFQQDLLQWFRENARKLPWRQTYSPYHVWISEIMLQQTQMDRAVAYFNTWISYFPDIKSITRASEEKILKLWEGLGYYSRAHNILKTARLLAKNFNGNLPEDYKSLLRLPGIGPYTAGAIMSIAFHREYPLVDANIERVFARLFNLDKQVKDKETQIFIWQKAREMIPPGCARDFNQALMELGALICIPRNPRCRICPVSSHCQALRLELVSKRPVLKNPSKTIFIEMATGVLERNSRVLIQKRKPSGVWPNLWEFPGGRLEHGETPEMALVREYNEETELAVGNLRKIITVQHSYTIYRVVLHCYFCSLLAGRDEPKLRGAQEYRWVNPAELSRYAFPAGHRKLIDHLFYSGYFS